MMMIKLDRIFGSMKLEPTMEFKDGVIYLGGKVTEYNRAGNVKSERHQVNCVCGFDEGPMTEAEAKEIMG